MNERLKDFPRGFVDSLSSTVDRARDFENLVLDKV